MPDAPRRLEDLFAGLDGVDDLDLVLARRALERTGAVDPRLPELGRRCAVARFVDVGVVAALIDTGATDAQVLLEELGRLRFVTRRPDGVLLFHDSVRDALLREWRQPEHADQLDDVSLLLAEHFEARYQRHRLAEEDLDEVGTTMRRVAPGRFLRLTSLLRSAMTTAVLESTHHRLTTSLDDGIAALDRWFTDLERNGHLSLCRPLVATVQDHLDRSPPDQVQPRHRARATYYDTRTMRTLPPYEVARAEAALRALLEDDSLDPVLEQWVLGDLAAVCDARMRMHEAMRLQERLEQAPVDLDPWNRPVTLVSLAHSYVWASRFTDAHRQFARAVDAAALPDSRGDLIVPALLGLCSMETELGRHDEALEHLFEALHLVRTRFGEDAARAHEVAQRAAMLLIDVDPLSSQAALDEALGLLRPAAARQGATVLHGYRSRAAGLGLVTMAGRAESRHETAVEPVRGETEAVAELLLAKARTSARTQDILDAERIYSECLLLLEGHPDPTWFLPVSLDERADVLIQLGRHEAGEADASRAADIWREAGCPVDAAASDTLRAKALLARGDVEQARRVLAEAAVHLGQDSPTLSFYHRVRGDLARRQGSLPEAQEQYEQALRIQTARGRLVGQADAVTCLAAIAEDSSGWRSMARWSQQGLDISLRLADLDAERGPLPDAAAANTNGVRHLVSPGNRRLALARAREELRTAVAVDPSCWWFSLNLSYACAEQLDWTGAHDALVAVLDQMPALERVPQLVSLADGFARESAVHCHRGGETGRAVALAARAWDRHAGGSTDPRLRLALLSTTFSLAVLHGDGALEADLGSVLRDTVHVPAVGPGAGAAVAPGISDPVVTVAANLPEIVRDVPDIWALHDAFDRLGGQGEADGLDDSDPMLATVHGELRWLLGRHLGMHVGGDDWSPFVLPLVLELGDDLVPLVDPAVDGGLFLHGLVVDARDRVRDSRGVEVPGVHARHNPALDPTGYVVQVREVPVASGQCHLDGGYAVAPYGPAARPRSEPSPSSRVLDFDPRTGHPGAWELLTDLRPGPVAGQITLTAQHYLCLVLEESVRVDLVRLLGIEETTRLLERWSLADETASLVRTVVPEQVDRLRLASVLRQLVQERVPVGDAHAVLQAVIGAGGPARPVHRLVDAVRSALLPFLPGNEAGRFQAVLPDIYGPRNGGAAEHDLTRWLRATTAEHGRWVTVVVPTPQDRRLLTPVLAREDHLVAVLAAAEVL